MAFALVEAKIDVVTNAATVVIRDGDAHSAQATEVVVNFPFTPQGSAQIEPEEHRHLPKRRKFSTWYLRQLLAEPVSPECAFDPLAARSLTAILARQPRCE